MRSHDLLTTGLLQVVNRLVASSLSKLVIHRFAASCFKKSANDEIDKLEATSYNKPFKYGCLIALPNSDLTSQ